MNRPIARGAVCLSALLVLSASAVPASEQTVQTLVRARQLKMLDEVVDLRDFQAPMTLKEALGLLQDKLNSKYKDEDVLPILVDAEAFKDDNTPDIYETQVRCPPFPRRMTVATTLRVILSQVPTRNATFRLRNGFVEITTLKEAHPKQALRQKVSASFDKRPLGTALEELSALTGLSVIVDPRLGDKLKEPVTAAFNNDVTLETALRLLADMTGAKLLITDDTPYLTSAANAETFLKERRAEREERRAQKEEAARRKRKAPAAPQPKKEGAKRNS